MNDRKKLEERKKVKVMEKREKTRNKPMKNE